MSDLVATVTEIDSLHRTNEALAQENARLSAENARAAELERQNTLLTELLQVKGALGVHDRRRLGHRPRDLRSSDGS